MSVEERAEKLKNEIEKHWKNGDLDRANYAGMTEKLNSIIYGEGEQGKYEAGLVSLVERRNPRT